MACIYLSPQCINVLKHFLHQFAFLDSTSQVSKITGEFPHNEFSSFEGVESPDVWSCFTLQFRRCFLNNTSKQGSLQYVDYIILTWNPNDLYFWRSTPQNKALFNQNKGHLGPREALVSIDLFSNQSHDIPSAFSGLSACPFFVLLRLGMRVRLLVAEIRLNHL